MLDVDYVYTLLARCEDKRRADEARASAARFGATRAWRRCADAPASAWSSAARVAAREGASSTPGPRPTRRRRGDESHRLRRPLDHAGPDRLPHPSRLRRRPRARIRAAPGAARPMRRSRAPAAASSPPSRHCARRARTQLVDASAAAPRRADRRRRRPRSRSSPATASTSPTSARCCAPRALARERATSIVSDASSARTRCRRKRPATRTPYRRTRLRTRCCRRSRAEGLADAVDAFCEGIAFSPERDRARVRGRARRCGLPVKLHADQLSNLHGAALAARFGALSADHLEYLDDAGAAAMARGRNRRRAAARRVLFHPRDQASADRGCSAATASRWRVATDCNPGTSPLTSLLLAMNMAATLFRLTVEECLAGVTREAARALGLAGRDRHAGGRQSGAISRSGTSSGRPNSSIAWASIRCTQRVWRGAMTESC